MKAPPPITRRRPMRPRMSIRAVVELAVLAFTLAGCARRYTVLHPASSARPRIQHLDLGIASAYVLYGTRPILIDTGPASSATDLVHALERLGVQRGSLALIVLTHGHADHAGGARRVRDEWGTPILAGAGDTSMLAAGHNRPLRPTSFFARLLRPFIDNPFPPFQPDLLVRDAFDLSYYGIEGQVIATPGHTPGSLVVLLRDGDAFTGDLFAGGSFGGAIFPSHPQTHYYHDDQARAEAQICTVIEHGARRLFLGHGGPVSAHDAWRRFCATRPEPPFVATSGTASPHPH